MGRDRQPTDRSPLPTVVWRIGWVSLFTDAATDMVYPLLPAFLRSIGGGARWLGIVEGVAEAVAALVKWRTGALVDRHQKKKQLVLIGYGISSAIRPLLALALAPWHVVLIRALDRVGKGVRSAPRDAILVAAVSPAQRAAAFGAHRMMDNMGAVFGPLLAFVLMGFAHLDLRTILALAVVPGALAVAMLVFGVKEPIDATAVAVDRPAASTHPPPFPPALKRYFVAVGLFSLGASADSFLLLRLSQQGLSEVWLPIAWLSLNLARSALNLPGGRLADRYGRKRVLMLAWLIYALVYAAFPFAHQIAETWALLIVYAAYSGLAEGSEKAIAADLAPKELRGRAFGTLAAVTGLAVLPANALFGVLFDVAPLYAFGTSAVFALVGAIVLRTVATEDDGRGGRSR
ncbi:MFS transporter [soil metagenome]